MVFLDSTKCGTPFFMPNITNTLSIAFFSLSILFFWFSSDLSRDAFDSRRDSMPFFQKVVTLPPHKRGCHLVTDLVMKEIEEGLSKFKIGMANFFIQHTSASITVCENYDSDVRVDLETSLNRIVPEDNKLYTHTLEGSDDMPAHVKSVLVGPSITIPITNGKLNLGTWQGLYLCEHRNQGGNRKIVVTLQGE